jgi:hypothetical protein
MEPNKKAWSSINSFQYSLVLKLCIMLSLQVDYLRRISSISRIELTDGRRGRGRGWGRMEPNKKAWSSINHFNTLWS